MADMQFMIETVQASDWGQVRAMPNSGFRPEIRPSCSGHARDDSGELGDFRLPPGLGRAA